MTVTLEKRWIQFIVALISMFFLVGLGNLSDDIVNSR
jgi:hypothetical protein